MGGYVYNYVYLFKSRLKGAASMMLSKKYLFHSL